MTTNLAFVFPGQGSQAVGMLADLAAQYPSVLDTLPKPRQLSGMTSGNCARMALKLT